MYATTVHKQRNEHSVLDFLRTLNSRSRDPLPRPVISRLTVNVHHAPGENSSSMVHGQVPTPAERRAIWKARLAAKLAGQEPKGRSLTSSNGSLSRPLVHAHLLNFIELHHESSWSGRHSESPPDATKPMLEDNLHFGCTFSDSSRFGRSGVGFGSEYKSLSAEGIRILGKEGKSSVPKVKASLRLLPEETSISQARWPLGLNGIRIVNHPVGHDRTQGIWPSKLPRVRGHDAYIVRYSIFLRKYHIDLKINLNISRILAFCRRLQIGTVLWLAKPKYCVLLVACFLQYLFMTILEKSQSSMLNHPRSSLHHLMRSMNAFLNLIDCPAPCIHR